MSRYMSPVWLQPWERFRDTLCVLLCLMRKSCHLNCFYGLIIYYFVLTEDRSSLFVMWYCGVIDQWLYWSLVCFFDNWIGIHIEIVRRYIGLFYFVINHLIIIFLILNRFLMIWKFINIWPGFLSVSVTFI